MPCNDNSSRFTKSRKGFFMKSAVSSKTSKGVNTKVDLIWIHPSLIGQCSGNQDDLELFRKQTFDSIDLKGDQHLYSHSKSMFIYKFHTYNISTPTSFAESLSIFLLSCLFLETFAQHLICFIQDQHFNSLHLSQQSHIDGIQDVDIPPWHPRNWKMLLSDHAQHLMTALFCWEISTGSTTSTGKSPKKRTRPGVPEMMWTPAWSLLPHISHIFFWITW